MVTNAYATFLFDIYLGLIVMVIKWLLDMTTIDGDCGS